MFLVHVKHFGKRNGDGAVVGIGFHDVCHVRPPLLADVCAAKVLASAFALQFLVGEQGVGLFVEVDAVVAHAALAEQGLEFGEEVGVAPFVLFFASGFQEHLEGFSFHGMVEIEVGALGGVLGLVNDDHGGSKSVLLE